MHNKFLVSVMIAGAALSLAGCDTAKEQLDFSKKAPDEFTVVRHQPLEMPPDYTIRAPQPGAPRPQEETTDQLAKQTILGPDVKTIAKREGVSEGEAILLKQTGGADASPSIRAKVDKETAELSDSQLPGVDKLKQMVGQKVEPPATVVDPVAESQRIKQNKDQGKPVTTGKTPSMKN